MAGLIRKARQPLMRLQPSSPAAIIQSTGHPPSHNASIAHVLEHPCHAPTHRNRRLLRLPAHPEISLHTPSLAGYVDCLNRGDWPGVAELMLAFVNKLAAIGADFLICPDNTIHQAFSYVQPRSPLPWLHIAEVVAAVGR